MTLSLGDRLLRFVNAAIPVGVAVFLALVVFDEWDAADRPGWMLVAGLGLALGQGTALRWRHSHPEIVVVIALFGGLGLLLLAPEVVIPIAGLFAVGSMAAARPPRVSLPALAGLVALAAGNFFVATAEDTAFTIALAVAAWALGEAVRNRRSAIAEGARRAVADEQTRIARELHDVIAHSVSVIVVQAAAADEVFDARPDQARGALRSIETTARDALRELRLLLADVRTGATHEDTHPLPGLDGLDELAAPLRAAGLAVEVTRQGTVRALPAGVDLSAYRIVQEALTNTLRHAGASRADVTVRYGSAALEVEVEDDGRGEAPPTAEGTGQGLIGMRERAAVLGGTLEAGARPGGGYRVSARLPLEPAA